MTAPQEFKLPADGKRVEIYTSIFALVGIVLFYQIDRVSPEPIWILKLLMLLAAFVAVKSIFRVFSFHIRMDEGGISKREFFRWKYWSWNDFSEGKIEVGPGRWEFHYKDTQNGSRNLDLGLGNEKDNDHLFNLCLEHWTPPPLSKPPEVLEFKFEPDMFTNKFPWRSIKVFLSKEGIRFVYNKNKESAYRWDEIEHLQIIRLTHNHANFERLIFKILNQEIVFEGDFKGASPSIISEALQHYLLQDAILNVGLHDKPRSIGEIDARMDYNETVRDTRRRLNRLFIGLFLFVFLIMPLIAIIKSQYGSWRTMAVNSFIMIAFSLILISIYWIGCLRWEKSHQKKQNDLEQMKKNIST